MQYQYIQPRDMITDDKQGAFEGEDPLNLNNDPKTMKYFDCPFLDFKCSLFWIDKRKLQKDQDIANQQLKKQKTKSVTGS